MGKTTPSAIDLTWSAGGAMAAGSSRTGCARARCTLATVVAKHERQGPRRGNAQQWWSRDQITPPPGLGKKNKGGKAKAGSMAIIQKNWQHLPGDLQRGIRAKGVQP